MARRLHFLDWLRALMICYVVYAHLTFCGLSDIDGEAADDCIYGGQNAAACLPTRWVAIARQWCIPLLFWVSGAASACSFKDRPRGLGRIAALTVVGIFSNATLWLLGPGDPECSISRPCTGRGVCFDFTVVPFNGTVFPYVNQMWYTIMLLLLAVLNWPLFLRLSGRPVRRLLAGQWLLTAAAYASALALEGADCSRPGLVFLWLCACEAAFLCVAVLASPSQRPPWLLLRIPHYGCALVTVLQFGATPFARQVSSISPGLVLFLFVGVNRFFELGFIMTRPRVEADGVGDVEPLLSQVWPLVLLVLVLVAPSTNWFMAGMLTYPYFPHALDRCLYVAGAVTIVFVLDRSSRGHRCRALPRVLALGSLLLYLFHPVCMTLLMWAGFRSLVLMLVISSASTIALAAGATPLTDLWCCGQPHGGLAGYSKMEGNGDAV